MNRASLLVIIAVSVLIISSISTPEVLPSQNELVDDDLQLSDLSDDLRDSDFIQFVDNRKSLEQTTIQQDSLTSFSTYIGGNYGDRCFDVYVDQSGNVYATGYTSSPDFPHLNGLNYSHSTWRDRSCFVLKMDSSGNLIFSTTIGGTEIDEGRSVAVDEEGNVYVAGVTQSPDFPTVNAFIEDHQGEYDFFVFKLNNTGNGLLYSTYFGGSERELYPHIAVNGTNAFVTGTTWSTDFPVVNAYDSTLQSTDCVIFKLDELGTEPLFSTFIGGSDDDRGNDIKVDDEGNIYVVGETSSYNFPLERPIYSGYAGVTDGFVLKLNSTGKELLLHEQIKCLTTEVAGKF